MHVAQPTAPGRPAKPAPYTGVAYDRAALPMRTDAVHRAHAAHIEETNHARAAEVTGINGLVILAQLKSIDFPRSFPPDSMHLFYENIVPDMCKHYRGVFYKPGQGSGAAGATAKASGSGAAGATAEASGSRAADMGDVDDSDGVETEATGSGSEASDNEPDDDELALEGGRKRKRTTQRGDSSKKKAKYPERVHVQPTPGSETEPKAKTTAAAAAKKEKYRKTNEPWNIKQAAWEKIGKDQKANLPSPVWQSTKRFQ